MAQFDLDTPLLILPSSAGTDTWTIRHALANLLIVGATNAGKSSGSGRTIVLNYMKAGFGGLFLTVKPTDVEDFRTYCALTGRTDDLVIIEPGGPHSFNILDHAARHGAGGLASTDMIVELLTQVIEAGQAQDGGRGDDKFWQEQLMMVLINSIELIRLAYNRVSVQDIYDVVRTIPHMDDTGNDLARGGKAFHKAFEAARANVTQQIDAWTQTLSAQDRIGFEDDDVFESALLDALPDARLLQLVDGYFIDEFIPLSEKTRSIISVSVSGFLFKLLREPFYSLFCRKESTICPEDCYAGKIVIVNLPTKLYHKVGRDIQLAVKLLFVRAWEQRDVRVYPRPCFLYIDESQEFLGEVDAKFLTTARSSRIATVFLTQSLSNFYAVMGGQRAEHRVRSLLGNFGTKIIHSNTEDVTNEFFSKLIGDAYFEDQTESVTIAQNFSHTRGRSLKLERILRPEAFTRLLTGGPMFNLCVEGYMHRQGESFVSGWNHRKLVFRQDYLPC